MFSELKGHSATPAAELYRYSEGTHPVCYNRVIAAFGLVAMIGCGNTETAPMNTDTKAALNPTVAEVTRESNEDQTMDNKPWRTDPALSGRFHPDYPDDLQVIVHDGGPRFTEKPPELIWVTVTAKDEKAFRGKSPQPTTRP